MRPSCLAPTACRSRLRQALAASPFAGDRQQTLPVVTALVWLSCQGVQHVFSADVPQPPRVLCALVLRGEQKEVLAKDLLLGVTAWDL